MQTLAWALGLLLAVMALRFLYICFMSMATI
jgi:hypothetical protein